jgi:putative membrane protein
MTVAADRAIFQIERPHPKLWTYYVLASLVAGPFFLFLLLPLYFRFRTLRYRFDEEGISMGWGILFRREIHLTYSRIQDIHLVANVVERWLGLARIQIQTASGSAKAEMTLEGLLEFELVRDFLYSRMRGLRDTGAAFAPRAGVAEAQLAGEQPQLEHARSDAGSPFELRPAAVRADVEADDALAAVLTEVAAELRAVRLALERSRGGRQEDTSDE